MRQARDTGKKEQRELDSQMEGTCEPDINKQ